VQHALAEDLARHVEALDHRVAGAPPGREPAGQQEDVGIAHLGQRGRGERGEAPVVVAENDQGRGRGHQGGQAQL